MLHGALEAAVQCHPPLPVGGLIARFLAWLIRGYQTLFAWPSPCRYVPTLRFCARSGPSGPGAAVARGWPRAAPLPPFASHGYIRPQATADVQRPRRRILARKAQ